MTMRRVWMQVGVAVALCGCGSNDNGNTITNGTPDGALVQNDLAGAITPDASGTIVPDAGVPADLAPVIDFAPEPPGLALVAGQLGGTGNVDGVGQNVRLFYPYGITFDSSGNGYFGDTAALRTINPVTGAVTTIAGTNAAYGTADGTGTAARFAKIVDLVSDNAGNLYIDDLNNFTIRQMNLATGAVTTLAGTAGTNGSADGTGTAASLFFPNNIALDGSGNLYVADYNMIRKIVIATKQVTTLPLTGSALSVAHGLAMDHANNRLYVGDGSLNILTINLATNVASIVATDTDTVHGIAYDGTGTLYTTDSAFNVKKVAITNGTGTFTAIAGGATGYADGVGTAARFNQPNGIALDHAGNLLVTDTSNSVIRKISISTATVSTFVGKAAYAFGNIDGVGSAAVFSTPVATAEDNSGNVYVAESYGHAIRKVVASTGTVTTLSGSATSSLYGGVSGLVYDGTGNLYIADAGNNTVTKLALSTNTLTVFAGRTATGTADGIGTAATFRGPSGIATDGTYLYISDGGANSIRQITIASQSVITVAGNPHLNANGSTDGTGTAALFWGPEGLAVDASGNLYVADNNNNEIRKVAVPVSGAANNGVVSTIAGTSTAGSADGIGGAAKFHNPVQVTLDQMGNLFVADSLNFTIRKIALSTNTVSTAVGVAGQQGVALEYGAASLNTVVGVSADANGNLYILSELSLLNYR